MLGRRVLVIDDEENLRHFLKMILEEEGYEVETAKDGMEALEKMEEKVWDIILCDIRMPKMDGMAFLQEVKARRMEGTVIMMSAYGTVDTAVEAMKIGAYDYVSKPFNADEIILTLKKAEERERLREENIRLREEVQRDYGLENIVAKSEKMAKIFDLIKKVARYKSSVLIIGESGTGKELVAKAIHYNSDRKEKALISVNCGAIPENLLESELFGHVKGAFTDAVRLKKGLFEMAHKGTMFLDEVGELPQSLQVKLLRVLQDGEIRRVGDTASAKVDVRIIAATAKDLAKEVKEGRFREDLYYRLSVLPIPLPPLRDRREDIPLLVDHFIDLYNRKLGLKINGVSREVMERFLQYPWPGNVRELENTIERAMVLAEGKILGAGLLPPYIREMTEEEMVSSKEVLSIKENARRMEKRLIKEALEATKGNRVRAARMLEISRMSLLHKMKEYGLEDYGKEGEM
ncbi:MAG: sigma-54-dependent Fis family transcriptional regulator [Deltaproteobacteria bacterium]|nr:sigma-54-dependent Fis family transcriptional regulator [Deltaproteobacteria bacterium]